MRRRRRGVIAPSTMKVKEWRKDYYDLMEATKIMVSLCRIIKGHTPSTDHIREMFDADNIQHATNALEVFDALERR